MHWARGVPPGMPRWAGQDRDSAIGNPFIVGVTAVTEGYMHAGLSVLQQAAEYGYPSTVYASHPGDVRPKMPGWAWLLVAVAMLSISVAGDPRTLP